MHPDPQTKSKSLFAVTELTLVATIKEGLIPAQDSRTYTSRAGLVLKALNTLRLSSKEVDPTPLIVDVVDGIRAIHSFRLSLLPRTQTQLRDQILLSVTFDGGWEPYMRKIQRDLGPLLDLVFHNTEGYLVSTDCSYADYTTWVRRNQVSTDFFHNAGALTVNDLHYLRRRETERLTGVMPSDPGTLPAAIAPNALAEQALPAIAALYRLSDMHPPDVMPDAQVLLRAAERLLGSTVMTRLPALKAHARTATEAAAVHWLERFEPEANRPRDERRPSMSEVQAGILAGHGLMTHGCLLLVSFDSAKAADDFIGAVALRITRADRVPAAGVPAVAWNLAFTYPGLVLAGLPAGLQQQVPAEFREGMAARSGILGDWRRNHPTRWCLPRRIGPVAAGGPNRAGDRVELSAIHAVIHLQIGAPADRVWRDPLTDAGHPLHRTVHDLRRELADMGVQVVAVEPMQRLPDPDQVQPQGLPRGHFDFVDGISQPTVTLPPLRAAQPLDEVEPGDLLLGCAGTLDPQPALSGPLWNDGSFLVVRKLRQDVPAYRDALTDAATQAGVAAPEVAARLMGRHVDGRNLIDDTPGNDFRYAGDAQGARCPFQAHVRRANPRAQPNTRSDQRHVPRFARRGMSYGPPLAADGANAAQERGLIFMAYNASIAEQFEAIQGWLAGGNSASRDSWSGQRDAFLGMPLDDEPQQVVLNGVPGAQGVVRVHLDPARPWVSLDWGVYLFAPSLPGLRELQRLAQAQARLDAPVTEDDKQRLKDRRDAERTARALRGAEYIRVLQLTEQMKGAQAARDAWKAALEDIGSRSTGVAEAIWTAIRTQHGGVLRTPYGVLVADSERVLNAFAAQPPELTANGYLERMRASFGDIYLGHDQGEDGLPYETQSLAPNQAIMNITRERAFDRALIDTCMVLAAWRAAAPAGFNMDVKDLIDDVLARVSNHFFGLPDGTQVMAGGWHWEEGEARCPGHFATPSRYMFQPRPGEQVTKVGQRHGNLLRAKALAFVQARRAHVVAPIGRAILDAFADDDLAARTLVGVMMGYLPTVDGNLRSALYEWVVDRRLWDLQAAVIDAVVRDPGKPLLDVASTQLLPELIRTVQLRPVPELTWRKAVTPHRLGNVDVLAGETVVIGIVSAAQQHLRDGKSDETHLYPVFGGDRRGQNAPTHACPGYEMALGVMLGMLAGLMLAVHLQPTLNPLALKVSAR